MSQNLFLESEEVMFVILESKTNWIASWQQSQSMKYLVLILKRCINVWVDYVLGSCLLRLRSIFGVWSIWWTGSAQKHYFVNIERWRGGCKINSSFDICDALSMLHMRFTFYNHSFFPKLVTFFSLYLILLGVTTEPNREHETIVSFN